MLNDIQKHLNIIEEFVQLKDIPILIDECDAAVGTIYGIYDNPNFVICNNEYNPSFITALICQILSLSSRIQFITHWAFYMEGKRLFEGNRTLITNSDLHLPFFNALKFFSKLNSNQLSVQIKDQNDEIYSLATIDDHCQSINILLCHHQDDWRRKETHSIDLILENVPLKSILFKHYQMDSVNNNIYHQWIQMGQPQLLNQQQLDQLKLFNSPKEYQITDKRFVVPSICLPTHSIALLQFIHSSSSSFSTDSTTS